MRTYGIRHWIEQGCKQVKDELAWAGFQVRSDTAIRRHQALVNCASCFCSAAWFADQPPQHDGAASRPEHGRAERGAAHRRTAAGAVLALGAAGGLSGLGAACRQAAAVRGPRWPGPDRAPAIRWVPSPGPIARTDTSGDHGRGAAAGGLR